MSNKVYQGYYYTDRDPVLDDINAVIDEAKVTPSQIHQVAMYGPDGKQVSANTIYRWRDKTKSPQHRTLAAVAHALGYRWALQKSGESQVVRNAPRKAKSKALVAAVSESGMVTVVPEWRLKSLKKAWRARRRNAKAKRIQAQLAAIESAGAPPA